MPESETILAALSVLWLPALLFGRLGRAAVPLTAAAGAGLFWLALGAAVPAGRLVIPALWAAASCRWVLARRAAAPARSAGKEGEERLREVGEKLALARKEFKEAGGREKKVLLLYSAMKYLAEAVDHQAAGRQFARYISDYFGTEDFAFYLLGSAGEAELFACGRDASSGFNTPEGLRRAAGLPGKGPPEPFIAGGVPPKAGVMVTHAGEAVGFFAAAFPAAVATAAELAAAMTAFTGEIAFAVRRLRLFRELEWLSRVDGLTGVFRRGVLDERIEEEVRRAQAFRTTFAVLIADIDHFKRLNDGYGHQFGDFVLKRVGTLLRESVYETDFVARYGGEEFAVLLPRAEPEGVLRKAEAIRARIAAENFSRGLESVRISVSIGVAHFPRDGRDAAGAVAAADAALYRAKESGRNRVVDASQL
jgi:diguanylate cyclase (GGDEF)-like protein